MNKNRLVSLVLGILIFFSIGVGSFLTNQDKVFGVISIFGILVCSTLLISESIKKSNSKKNKKLKSNITGIMSGLIFIVIPLSIFLIGEKVDIFPKIILLFLLILGVLIVFSTLFMWNKKKIVVLRVKEIDKENKVVLFNAENASKFEIFKSYKYEPKKIEMFDVGDKFEINLYEYGVVLKTDDPEGVDEYEYIEPRIPNIVLSSFKDSDFKKVY